MQQGPERTRAWWSRAAGAVVACAGWLCACGGTDVIAELARDPAAPSGEAGTAGSAVDAGMMATSAGAAGPSVSGVPELDAWCSGRGGLWLIRGSGQAAFGCAGELAARSFSRALCACGTVTGPGAVTTTTLLPDGSTRASGATVGINGTAPASSTPGAVPPGSVGMASWSVGGDLLLAGRPAMFASGPQRVTGSLRSATLLGSSSGTALRIDGDAWLPLATALLDPRALDVGGELVLTPDGPAAESQRWSSARTGGGIRRADADDPPPCACDLEQAPDVPAMVTWAASNNDNAQLGFPPEQLYWVAQARTVSLPCGRFHFPTINGSGVLTVRIDQPVALFVGDLLGFIEIELGPGGSLDLFVSGWFNPRGGRLGDNARPAATRIYVHDQPMPGPLAMLGELTSNFYGPTIGVQTFGVRRRGSMVVRDAIVNDGLRVDYDPRVTQVSCGR